MSNKTTVHAHGNCETCREELAREREDAERYRWIRLAGVDADISDKFVSVCESEPESPELFDAAIDQARKMP